MKSAFDVLLARSPFLRIPDYLLKRILRFACFVDEDDIAQNTLSTHRYNLPNGPSFLRRVADGEEISEVARGIEELDDDAINLKRIGSSAAGVSNGARCSTYHRTSRSALLSSLVCKHWYDIAHPFLFHHLYVNDDCDWLTLALRLGRPAYSIGTTSKSTNAETLSTASSPASGRTSPIPIQSPVIQSPVRPPVGYYVKWLDVITDDLEEADQVALTLILARMERLRGIVVNTLPTHPELESFTTLSATSSLMLLLSDSLRRTCKSLEFVSLTMSLTFSAVRPLLITLEKFVDTSVFVLRFDTKSKDGYSIMHGNDSTVTFANLRVVLFESMLTGDYPYLSHIARWRIQCLRSLFLLSHSMLTGGRLIAHRNYTQLEDMMIQPSYFYAQTSIPSSKSLRRVITSENVFETAFTVRYDNVEYIGLKGKLDYPKMNGSFPRLGVLDSGIRAVVKRGNFPRLNTVQFLDIVASSFMGQKWRRDDAVIWFRWSFGLGQLGVRIVDWYGDNLPISPPNVDQVVLVDLGPVMVADWIRDKKTEGNDVDSDSDVSRLRASSPVSEAEDMPELMLAL